MEPFTQAVIQIIANIPAGKVSTYGRIGLMAGQPNGARQVTRILHAMSRKYHLPWHRVVNARGKISLGRYKGYAIQRARLEHEGVVFEENDRIDLARFLWDGRLA
jgi:methylated-DNA-protein-cysteine methyltransferase-like protein